MRAFLVRHGMCAPVGRILAGRRMGIHLSELGRAQAAKIAHYLKSQRIAAVYSSPVERAMETAEAIRDGTGTRLEAVEALTEFDFGAWSGREIASLQGDDTWTRFNTYRSGTRAPDGELAIEAQARAVAALYRLGERHAGERIAVVSHADVIRSVLAHLLGIPLDLQHRVELDPGSLSTVELHPAGARVLCTNHTER